MTECTLDKFQRHAFIIHQLSAGMTKRMRGVELMVQRPIELQVKFFIQCFNYLMECFVVKVRKQFSFPVAILFEIKIKADGHRLEKDNGFFVPVTSSFAPDGDHRLFEINIIHAEPFHFHGTKPIVSHERYDGFLLRGAAKLQKFIALLFGQTFLVIKFAWAGLRIDGGYITQRPGTYITKRRFDLSLLYREFIVGRGDVTERPFGKSLKHRSIKTRSERGKTLGENETLCSDLFKVADLTDRNKGVVENGGVSGKRFARFQTISC